MGNGDGIMGNVNVGDVFKINSGGTIKVLQYNSFNDILVEHQDENKHKVTTTANNIKNGNIKNPYLPSIFGIGYIGSGKYKCKEDRKSTTAYKKWYKMMRRAYCNKYKSKNPTYNDVRVYYRWHNFQNFAAWYYNQPNSDKEGFELDKDLMVLGNKEYHPEKCSLVPKPINNLLISCLDNGGSLPIGVRKNGSGYQAAISMYGKMKSLGTYKTPNEAHCVYNREKCLYVKELANKYRGVIHDDVYRNLMHWGHSLDSK